LTYSYQSLQYNDIHYIVMMMSEEKEKVQKIITLLAEIIYELYKDLKNGKLQNEIYSVNKQVVGKSARKAKTFQQTAFVFKK